MLAERPTDRPTVRDHNLEDVHLGLIICLDLCFRLSNYPNHITCTGITKGLLSCWRASLHLTTEYYESRDGKSLNVNSSLRERGPAIPAFSWSNSGNPSPSFPFPRAGVARTCDAAASSSPSPETFEGQARARAETDFRHADTPIVICSKKEST